MVLSWFFPTSGKKPFSQQLTDDLIGEVTEALQDTVPEIQQSIKTYLNDTKKGFQKGLKDVMLENKDSINEEQVNLIRSKTKEYFNSAIKTFTDYITDNSKKELTPEMIAAINIFKGTIEHKEGVVMATYDVSERNLKNYNQKVERAKSYLDLIKTQKKEIKILIIGGTQKGKTSLACLISGVKKNDIEGARTNGFGLTSDTTQIQPYIIEKNGVKLIWVDTPGWWDSRGAEQSAINKKTIETYIQNNKDIDIIMIVAKLGDTLDGNQQDAIKDFGKSCGQEIWEKTMVVLSYANSVETPTEYMEKAYYTFNPNDSEINTYNPEMPKIRLEAWVNFVNNSTLMWRNYFSQHIKNDVQIPVCLVENNQFQWPQKNGKSILLLRDGTPFLEELMYELLTIVDRKKTPIIFLAMAANTNSAQPGTSPPSQHQLTLNAAADRMLNQIQPPATPPPVTTTPIKPPELVPVGTPVPVAKPAVATPTPAAPVATPVTAPVVAPVVVKPVVAPVAAPVVAPVVPAAAPRIETRSGNNQAKKGWLPCLLL